MLFGFRPYVESHGGDPEALMVQVGLDPCLLEEMDLTLPFYKIVQLMELTATTLNRPSYGLERTLFLPPHFPNLGPIVQLSYFVRDLEGFLTTGLRYWHFHTNAFYFTLIKPEHSHEFSLRLHSSDFSPLGPQFVDTTLSTIVMLGQFAANKPDTYPSHMRFKHAKPADVSTYDKIFKCPLEFGAQYDEIVFDKSILKFKTIKSLSALRPIMQKFVSLKLSRMANYDNSFPTTVSMVISGLLGTGNCNKPNVAAILCIGEKKMQRLLSQHQTNFRTILDQTRKNTTMELIEDPNVPFINISGLLDYQTQQAFNAAFARWHGCSPSQYRRNIQKNGSILDDPARVEPTHFFENTVAQY